MIWIYRFSDGFVLEKGDSLTTIELENLIQIHGCVTFDVKSR